jgi:hypothetical protein
MSYEGETSRAIVALVVRPSRTWERTAVTWKRPQRGSRPSVKSRTRNDSRRAPKTITPPQAPKTGFEFTVKSLEFLPAQSETSQPVSGEVWVGEVPELFQDDDFKRKCGGAMKSILETHALTETQRQQEEVKNAGKKVKRQKRKEKDGEAGSPKRQWRIGMFAEDTDASEEDEAALPKKAKAHATQRNKAPAFGGTATQAPWRAPSAPDPSSGFSSSASTSLAAPAAVFASILRDGGGASASSAAASTSIVAVVAAPSDPDEVADAAMAMALAAAGGARTTRGAPTQDPFVQVGWCDG